MCNSHPPKSEDLFSDLEDDFDKVATKKCGKFGERIKFPCSACAGSGNWKHGTNSYGNHKCHACQGRGHFFTSSEHRHNLRVKAKDTRETKAAANIQKGKAFLEANPELFQYMKDVSDWNAFALDMLDTLMRKGEWTSNQEAAVMKMFNKHQARLDLTDVSWVDTHKDLFDYLNEVASWNAFAGKMVEAINRFGALTPNQEKAVQNMYDTHKAKSKEIKENKFDLTKIMELLQVALDSGLKKPKLRCQNLKISFAPAHGRNAGFLYVHCGSDYVGKINREGEFWSLKTTPDHVLPTLKTIAEDPKAAITMHGQKTGECGCCGRELTDPNSVASGIGPVCAGKWGL